MCEWGHVAIGDELLGDLLPSGQLDVYQGHAYSDHPQRDPHQVRIFFLSYTRDDIKSYIFMELPTGFEVEGLHPIEWVIILDKNYMA